MRLLQPLRITAIMLVAACWCAADPASDAARQLASQVAVKAGAGAAIAFSMRNISSMPDRQFAELQQTVASALRGRGMEQVDKSRAVAEVEVTLSENARSYLLVAQIRQGQTQDVAIVPMPRTHAEGVAAGSAALALRVTPVWTQEDPILDAALLQAGSSSQLLVLDTKKIALYALNSGTPTVLSSQQYGMNFPRDPRGRLVLRRDHLFDAYLPGLMCSSAGHVVQGAQCRTTDDPWPLDPEGTRNGFFAATRNFFTGTLSGVGMRGLDVGAFYSAATVGGTTYFTGTDGRVRVLSGGRVSISDVEGWGSDIAALTSGCGTGTQLVADSDGDNSAPDSVQAYEISGQDWIAASQKAEFSGPITALWTAADHASVMAVSHNLKTGRYEAALLTLTCSR